MTGSTVEGLQGFELVRAFTCLAGEGQRHCLSAHFHLEMERHSNKKEKNDETTYRLRKPLSGCRDTHAAAHRFADPLRKL